MDLPFNSLSVLDDNNYTPKDDVRGWEIANGLMDTNQRITVTVPSAMEATVPLFSLMCTPNYCTPYNSYSLAAQLPVPIYANPAQTNIKYSYVGPMCSVAYLAQCHYGAKWDSMTIALKVNGSVIEKGNFKVTYIPFLKVSMPASQYNPLPSLPYAAIKNAYPVGLAEGNFIQFDSSTNRFLQVTIPWELRNTYLKMHGNFVETSFLNVYMTSDLLSSLTTETTITLSVYIGFENLQFLFPKPALPMTYAIYQSTDATKDQNKVFTIPAAWTTDGGRLWIEPPSPEKENDKKQ